MKHVDQEKKEQFFNPNEDLSVSTFGQALFDISG